MRYQVQLKPNRKPEIKQLELNRRKLKQKKKSDGMEIEIDLFDGNKLPGVEVHSHVDVTEAAGTDQLALAPPYRRRRFEGDSRFANGGAELVGDSGKRGIVTAGSENQGAAKGAQKVLHVCG